MVATPSRRYEVHSKVPAVRPLCVDTPDLFPIGGPVKGRFVAVPILDWLAILVIGNGANASVDHIAFISKTRVGKLVVIGCTVDARWMPAKTSISEVLSKVPDSSLGRLPPSKLSKRVTVELEEGSWGLLTLCLPKTGAGLRLPSSLPGLTQLRRGSTAHLCCSLESHGRRYTLWVDAVGEEDETWLLTPEGPGGGKIMTVRRTEELALRIGKVAREERGSKPKVDKKYGRYAFTRSEAI